MPNTTVAFATAGNFPGVTFDGEYIGGNGFTLSKSGEKIYVHAGTVQIVIDANTSVTIDGGGALTGDMNAKLLSLQTGLNPGSFFTP